MLFKLGSFGSLALALSFATTGCLGAPPDDETDIAEAASADSFGAAHPGAPYGAPKDGYSMPPVYGTPNGGYQPSYGGGHQPPHGGGYDPPHGDGYKPPSYGGGYGDWYHPPYGGGYKPPPYGGGHGGGYKPPPYGDGYGGGYNPPPCGDGH